MTICLNGASSFSFILCCCSTSFCYFVSEARAETHRHHFTQYTVSSSLATKATVYMYFERNSAPETERKNEKKSINSAIFAFEWKLAGLHTSKSIVIQTIYFRSAFDYVLWNNFIFLSLRRLHCRRRGCCCCFVMIMIGL